ncbi:MAG: DivIVA domain-containing protein [Micromonosporaceae bacterium]
MTSQGQRFRRRALRRGYKVDEVDAFLDRVEATLAGDPIGAAVTAQEVHDVVFRVRFGGYDEWQVDLHLDRVERQLGDMEERGAGFGRPESRMGAALREERLAGLREDRMDPPMRPSMAPPPMPSRPLNPMVAAPMSGPPLMGNPMAPMSGPPSRQPHHHMAPAGPPGGGYPRFDDTEYTTGGFGRDMSGGGRRARMDMTHEMRMPDISSSFPISGSGYGGGASPADLQRIDAMRRTFTPRRFGSGYDAVQVNRLFDAIVASLSGRSGMPINEQELDPNQFSLVPGGYFEAEVNQALREVRDLVVRR